jgi:hypothetical protein
MVASRLLATPVFRFGFPPGTWFFLSELGLHPVCFVISDVSLQQVTGFEFEDRSIQT